MFGVLAGDGDVLEPGDTVVNVEFSFLSFEINPKEKDRFLTLGGTGFEGRSEEEAKGCGSGGLLFFGDSAFISSDVWLGGV